MVLKHSRKNSLLHGFSLRRIRIPSEFRIHNTMEFIYLALYMTYSFFNILNTSTIEIDMLMKLVKLMVSISLPCLYLLKKGHTVKSMAVSAIVFIVYFISSRTADKTVLIFYALFIINADLTDFKKIAKCSIASTMTATLMVIFLSKVGVLPDYIFLRGLEKAHCLGFVYYSHYPYILLFNMLSYMYLKQDKLTVIHLAVMLGINYYLYRLSTLRLTYYLTILIMIAYILIVKMKVVSLNNKWIKRLVLLLYPAMFGVAMYTSLHYTPGKRKWRLLNDLLSSRLELQSEAFSRYHIKLFGQYVETRSLINGIIARYNYFYIDSGFIYSVLAYGLIFTVVLIIIYSFLIHRCCQKNDAVAVIWLGALSAFTVINNVWINIPYNCIMMMLMIEIANRQKGQESISSYLERLQNGNHGHRINLSRE